MERDKILSNVKNLSAEQLYDYIKQNIVSLNDLMGTGDLDSSKRLKIDSLLGEQSKLDEDAWERARYGNELDLGNYISTFPNGKYVQEAKNKINYFEQERKKREAAKQSILNKLKNNLNAYDHFEIQSYLNDGTLSRSDLLDCNVPESVIDSLYDIKPPQLVLGQTPDYIPKEYTEVYFWGIPGSGKTCALAAVISTAHKLGYLNKAVGPGFDYMTRLNNIFIQENALLPEPSPVDTTQYLPFTLKKPNEKYHRSISLIELSGEIFESFYRKNANLNFVTDVHESTFNSLNRFLKGDNRKIHFFFIDYSKNNTPDGNNYTQSDYLEAAATYFKNNQVFGKSTDAIYVVLTKSDLMDCSESERVHFAKEHIKNQNFTAFINVLKDNCKKYSINGGKLFVEPFSLGNVFFQKICNFDNTTAKRVVEILMDRVPPSKKSILDIFNK